MAGDWSTLREPATRVGIAAGSAYLVWSTWYSRSYESTSYSTSKKKKRVEDKCGLWRHLAQFDATPSTWVTLQLNL
jgi:hypothetical protein